LPLLEISSNLFLEKLRFWKPRVLLCRQHCFGARSSFH